MLWCKIQRDAKEDGTLFVRGVYMSFFTKLTNGRNVNALNSRKQ